MAAWLDDGPTPETDNLSCWTVADICQRIMNHFHMQFTIEAMRRLIQRLGISHLSPRPLHPHAGHVAQTQFRDYVMQRVKDVIPDGLPLRDV